MTAQLPPFLIRQIALQGFRAYLAPCSFPFDQKLSLAVFAPNGTGKSSMVDGLEFMFSDAGTLDRLGQRAINNNAGPWALAHNLAAEHKIEPKVTVTFSRGQICAEVSRGTGDDRQARPHHATVVKKEFVVDPIIRGHALRHFVEEQKAEDRYAEVARWLQLTPLVTVQRNLRNLRSQVKSATEDPAPMGAIDREISRETDRKVMQWDDDEVLSFINNAVLVPLDDKLKMKTLDKSDPAVATVKARADVEEERIGLATLKQARDAVVALYSESADEETGEVTTSGTIPTFVAAIARHDEAVAKEEEERGKAAAAVFASVWKAAEPLFAEGKPELDNCPVCDTPIGETASGSMEGIRTTIAAHRADLADYSAAKEELDAAKESATKVGNGLIAKLDAVPATALDAHDSLKAAIEGFVAALKAKLRACPDATVLTKALTETAASLSAVIKEVEEGQGDHTYRKAQAKIDQILQLANKRALEQRIREELIALHESLNEQASFVSSEIRTTVQSLLDSLRKPLNEIYAAIQGDAAIPVRLELPPEDDTNQQRLNLLIDFAPNREGVQPSGFLSDSQIHTLALSLRLAAIQKFNVGAPFIVLDDIVTSYDADHRRRISGLLADRFGAMQLIVTTHDERFFLFLKDQLPQKGWSFKRVVRFERDHGPIFADHKIGDDLIEARWTQGESAANEMRQAEEEWLLTKCREFGARVVIRPIERAHSYERSELAESLRVI